MSYIPTFLENCFAAAAAKRTRAARAGAVHLTAVEVLEGRQLLSAVSIANAAVNEGGKLLYSVTLNAPSGKPVTVRYAMAGGTAVANRDFLPLKPGTLTFAPGQTSKTLTVKTKANKLFSPNKTIFLRLSAPSAGNKIKGPGLAKGVILNTDAKPVITIANAATAEGKSGNKILTFTVKMTGAAGEKPLRVSYATANSSAKSAGKNSDFVAAKGTLTFTALNRPQTIKVLVRGDKIKEANEAFLVNLKGAGLTVRNPLVPGATFAVGVIKNDDGGAVSANTTVVATSPADPVTPGSAANVTLALNHISADPVTVTYNTANGTAVAGTDFTNTNTTVTFNPGETSKVITVPTLANSAGGTFTVNLASATAATVATPFSTVTIATTAADVTTSLPTTGTGVTFGTATGFTFFIDPATHLTRATSLNYELVNANSAPITNAKLQFFFLADPANPNDASAVPYDTVDIGTIPAGDSLTGTATITSDVTTHYSTPSHYYARLIANGIAYPATITASIVFNHGN